MSSALFVPFSADIARALRDEREWDESHPLAAAIHGTDDERIVTRLPAGFDLAALLKDEAPVLAVVRLPAPGADADWHQIADNICAEIYARGGEFAPPLSLEELSAFVRPA